MSSKLANALAAESALVAFESLTNRTLPLRPTCSIRWGRPGKSLKPFLNGGGIIAGRCASRDRTSRVLGIVHPAQRSDPCKICHDHRIAAFRPQDATSLRVIAVCQRRHDGNTHDIFSDALDLIGCSERKAVINIDHGRTTRFHVCWKALFDGRVIFDSSVTVDMIFGHVKKYAHSRPERRRQIDLV